MNLTVLYKGGAIYTTDLTAWEMMPATGLLVVIEHTPTGRTIHSGADWYWFSRGRIRTKPSGEWGTWMKAPKTKAHVKRGAATTDEEFNRAYNYSVRHGHFTRTD